MPGAVPQLLHATALSAKLGLPFAAAWIWIKSSCNHARHRLTSAEVRPGRSVMFLSLHRVLSEPSIHGLQLDAWLHSLAVSKLILNLGVCSRYYAGSKVRATKAEHAELADRAPPHAPGKATGQLQRPEASPFRFPCSRAMLTTCHLEQQLRHMAGALLNKPTVLQAGH